MESQQEMSFPSAPEIDGPEGGEGERCRRTLTACVDHELLLGVVILLADHAAAKSDQFLEVWPFPVHAQLGLHFLAFLLKVV